MSTTSKIQSIKALKAMGLNVPKLLLELHTKDDLEAWKKYYSEHDGRVSIRTEKGPDFKCPHHPNIKLNKADREVHYLLSQGYNLYIFEPINPDDCVCRGNFVRFKDGTCIAEWLDGSGTVRDLEKVSPDMINSVTFKALDALAGYPYIYSVVKCLIPLNRFTDEIVEWSYYKKQVGERKDYAIFWERRPWV